MVSFFFVLGVFKYKNVRLFTRANGGMFGLFVAY